MALSFDYRDVDLVVTEVEGGLAVVVAEVAAAVLAVAGLAVAAGLAAVAAELVAEPVAAAVTELDVAGSASAPCTVVSIPGSCSRERPHPYPQKLLEPCMEARHPAETHAGCFAQFCAALVEVLPAEFFPPPVSAGPPLPWPAASSALIHLHLAIDWVEQAAGPSADLTTADLDLDWAESWPWEAASRGGEYSSCVDGCRRVGGGSHRRWMGRNSSKRLIVEVSTHGGSGTRSAMVA